MPMISVLKVYNYLYGSFLFCGLLALVGFLVTFLGWSVYVGWFLGVVGVCLGNLSLIIYFVITFLGKNIKFIRNRVDYDKRK